MKTRKKLLRSTYRERLFLQERRDEESGLLFADRIFLPTKEAKPHPVLWYLADTFTLALVIAGLFLLLIPGFSLRPEYWFYPGLLFSCFLGTALSTVLAKGKWSRGKKLGFGFLFIILFAVVLYLVQYMFLNGAHVFYYQLRETIKHTYQEKEAVTEVIGNGFDTAVFLSVLGFVSALWLAYSIYVKENFPMALFLLVPAIGLIILCGGWTNVPAMFSLMFGILGFFMSTRTVRHKRLWGGGAHGLNSLYQKNVLRFQKIQKQNLFLVFLMALILAIPGFYLVRPFLNMRLKPAERTALRVQSNILNKVLEVLPEITADEWNLEVKSVGGGVSDGALQDVDGYQLKDVEDLKITLSDKPFETIYLKGFVGSRYADNEWLEGYENSFDGAAMNWKTQGNARLYVQNMPFLRTASVVGKMESGIAGDGTGVADVGDSTGVAGVDVGGSGEPGDGEDAGGSGESGSQGTSIPANMMNMVDPSLITVEVINANDHYTYVPYATFLNDYYEVSGGDGFIHHQEQADDSYYFYFRDDYETILKNWTDMDVSQDVLDQLETSYHAYCTSMYLDVADGLDEIQAVVEKAKKEKSLNAQFDINQIISWVRVFLNENYEYEINTEALEPDQDFLTTFLFQTRKGYSIHFASAAVEIFRMFGVPARYVIGYEAPAAIFSVQTDKTYTATLQDDNAQAWAEVYVGGVGWIPVDVTPGMVGTLAEVGPGGEKIRTYNYEEEDMRLEQETEVVEEKTPLTPYTVMSRLTEWINGLFHTQATVEQVIQLLTALVIFLFILITTLVSLSRYCRNNGYDPFRKRDRFERFVLIFLALYKKLEKNGMPKGTESSSDAFLEYVEKYAEKKKKPDLPDGVRAIRDVLYECCYGDAEPTEEQIMEMRKLYRG